MVAENDNLNKVFLVFENMAMGLRNYDKKRKDLKERVLRRIEDAPIENPVYLYYFSEENSQTLNYFLRKGVISLDEIDLALAVNVNRVVRKSYENFIERQRENPREELDHYEPLARTIAYGIKIGKMTSKEIERLNLGDSLQGFMENHYRADYIQMQRNSILNPKNPIENIRSYLVGGDSGHCCEAH